MPPCRCRHLAMPQKTLLHDPDLIRIAPISPTRHIRGREDFDLGSELMVGHKVGLSTDVEIPSDGLRRRDTFRGPFDAIFCRNVAIYFDQETQQTLWANLARMLREGGLLFIGHSERVSGPATSDLATAGVTTYRKRPGRDRPATN